MNSKHCLMIDGADAVETAEEPVINTDVNLCVSSLSLVLNKTQYELARAQVTGVVAHVNTHDGNLSIDGRLGSLLLQDMSPHGSLFRERFVTTGSEALTFDIFKYESLYGVL